MTCSRIINKKTPLLDRYNFMIRCNSGVIRYWNGCGLAYLAVLLQVYWLNCCFSLLCHMCLNLCMGRVIWFSISLRDTSEDCWSMFYRLSAPTSNVKLLMSCLCLFELAYYSNTLHCSHLINVITGKYVRNPYFGIAVQCYIIILLAVYLFVIILQ